MAVAGWLAERIGRRAAMILAGIVFALGCAMSAAAPSIALFLAGRVVQGAAAGWIGGLIYVAMALLFPGRHLPQVFALRENPQAVPVDHEAGMIIRKLS